MKNILWLNFICWKLFASATDVSSHSFEGRIVITNDKLLVRYEHQLEDGTNDFAQTIDTTTFHGVVPNNCSSSGKKIYCLQWGSFAEYQITKIDKNCEKYEYKTEFDEPLSVAFNISNVHLYGGDEIDNQSWPIKTTGDRKLEAFVSKAYNSEAVLEPIWYTSTGHYVHVARYVPLFVRLHNGTLRLIAERKTPYLRGNITYLNYRVCKYDDVKTAFQRAAVDSLGRPTAAPDYKMVELPVWSTKAKYRSDINESTVLEFADLIGAHLLPSSQLEIDDRWESCYGSMAVDTARFPDMKRLVRRIHAKGYRVTLWVHPFVNIDCEPYFSVGRRNGYFVRNVNGSVSTRWWNGAGAHIDFTNPAATDWYQTRLKKLIAETGVDSFRFDAGESSWSPQVTVYQTPDDDQPETNLKRYVHAAASFGNAVEVRSARQTQHHPIFVRMVDRETVWTGRLAASTLIPELLHMNVIGYPFVLPDMIGGSVYHKDTLTEELFVRWLQMTVFMPSLQFSYPPWDFSDKVVNITRKFIDLHAAYAPKIYELMKQSTREATMVNAPLWWIDPADPITFAIDSQFLLGDEVLVAPVTEKGATSRNIYFPKGVWRDENNRSSPLINGPTWIHNYPADLEVLPYFVKVANRASTRSTLFLFIIAINLFLRQCR